MPAQVESSSMNTHHLHQKTNPGGSYSLCTASLSVLSERYNPYPELRERTKCIYILLQVQEEQDWAGPFAHLRGN
jgi:hypothetical protein